MGLMESSQGADRLDRRWESGVVFVALVVTILPLALAIGIASTLMSGRTSRLTHTIGKTRSLLAAESGVDEALFRASVGTLPVGVAFSRSMDRGMRFTVLPVYLRTDGLDNDLDGMVDEPDEDLYRVTVTGAYRMHRTRVVAYLGPIPEIPTGTSSLILEGPPQLDINSDAVVSGVDTRIDGSPGEATNDVPGIVVSPPSTVEDALGELSASEEAQVQGTGAPPSVGDNPTPNDVVTLVSGYRNVADNVLTGRKYDGLRFGDASTGEFRVTFRDGDLHLQGASGGAGVLVVTGDLLLQDSTSFDGLVVVLGRLMVQHESEIRGAVISGSGVVFVHQYSRIRYSKEAIGLAAQALGSGLYLSFNGWQRVSRD